MDSGTYAAAAAILKLAPAILGVSAISQHPKSDFPTELLFMEKPVVTFDDRRLRFCVPRDIIPANSWLLGAIDPGSPFAIISHSSVDTLIEIPWSAVMSLSYCGAAVRTWWHDDRSPGSGVVTFNLHPVNFSVVSVRADARFVLSPAYLKGLFEVMKRRYPVIHVGNMGPNVHDIECELKGDGVEFSGSADGSYVSKYTVAELKERGMGFRCTDGVPFTQETTTPVGQFAGGRVFFAFSPDEFSKFSIHDWHWRMEGAARCSIDLYCSRVNVK